MEPEDVAASASVSCWNFSRYWFVSHGWSLKKWLLVVGSTSFSYMSCCALTTIQEFNLLEKLPVLARFDANFGKGSGEGKMSLNSTAGHREIFHVKKIILNWVYITVILYEIVTLQWLPSWEVSNHQRWDHHYSLAVSTQWGKLENRIFLALPRKNIDKPVPPKFERHTYKYKNSYIFKPKPSV